MPMTKQGFRRLKRSASRNPDLDVEAFCERLKRKDAERIWDRLSPTQRIKLLQQMQEKSDVQDQAKEPGARKQR